MEKPAQKLDWQQLQLEGGNHSDQETMLQKVPVNREQDPFQPLRQLKISKIFKSISTLQKIREIFKTQEIKGEKI